MYRDSQKYFDTLQSTAGNYLRYLIEINCNRFATRNGMELTYVIRIYKNIFTNCYQGGEEAEQIKTN